ncbi:DNA-binding MarR family transcriptional regulator [Cryobacterium sp. MP_M5]|uniref:MarR family winged helix-turn-helix transcriptional regulator n=1 Tax=unclassified Cryobacterium TaxID=2649013 RepID=UPI0018C9C2B5|nr:MULTISPECIES: MarR family winged helix-turn-helix transcriptional regulator [unclassified Cryobacterium]MBG6056782.1 DNA-binding MarR family transcriptional regulator [Cryobacterium sp. MP_M3]MEC5176453.1 DNA-binding MarR family transcriptional regulator [Cryobacterium sp. MP_M5]
MTQTSQGDTGAAIAEVEEQMSVLAGHIRASMRDAALSIDPALQPFGLKMLRLLARCGPTHASAVAAALYVDKSVISRQARLLCDLGLLETQVDPADGRARFLAVTPEAVRKLAEVRAGDTAIVHRRLGSWPAGELRELARLLAKLNTP